MKNYKAYPSPSTEVGTGLSAEDIARLKAHEKSLKSRNGFVGKVVDNIGKVSTGVVTAVLLLAGLANREHVRDVAGAALGYVDPNSDPPPEYSNYKLSLKFPINRLSELEYRIKLRDSGKETLTDGELIVGIDNMMGAVHAQLKMPDRLKDPVFLAEITKQLRRAHKILTEDVADKSKTVGTLANRISGLMYLFEKLQCDGDALKAGETARSIMLEGIESNSNTTNAIQAESDQKFIAALEKDIARLRLKVNPNQESTIILTGGSRRESDDGSISQASSDSDERK